jgi:uncharacterized protein YkwD
MAGMLLLFIFLSAFGSGEKYLDKIPLYQQDSYFKSKVYAEHTWKTFYKLKEANEPIDANKYDMHLLGAAVFFATNKLREEKGAKAFQFSPELRDAAVVHSWQMIEHNFFDHFNHFNPALRAPDQRIHLFKPNAMAYAENIDLNHIIVSQSTTYIQLGEKIVKELYNSPPHRTNMMNKAYHYTGCSAIFEAHDKTGARIVKATQDFSS